MQESAPAVVDAVVQTLKERLAKKKLAVQPVQAKATKLRRRSKREEEDKRTAALPDGEREKDVEAAEKIAEQETFRRSVAAHMSRQQATSSAYMMHPDTPADSALPWLLLVTSVARVGTRLLHA
jgi:hypothetical protein